LGAAEYRVFHMHPPPHMPCILLLICHASSSSYARHLNTCWARLSTACFTYRTWSLGMLVFAVGNGGDFIALGLTKQSIVTLVGAQTLAVNTVIAKCLLGIENTFYIEHILCRTHYIPDVGC
jgi:hypothetical protein